MAYPSSPDPKISFMADRPWFLLEKLGYRDIFPTKHHVWQIFWILFGEHW
jgi:hypothetical protein